MNEFRLFSQWLWSRPLIKSLNYRPPIPRIFWNLVSYLCFLVVGYSSLKLFAPQRKKKGLSPHTTTYGSSSPLDSSFAA